MEVAAAAAALVDAACAPFDNPQLRGALIAIQQRDEITIDRVSEDSVLEAGYSATDTNFT